MTRCRKAAQLMAPTSSIARSHTASSSAATGAASGPFSSPGVACAGASFLSHKETFYLEDRQMLDGMVTNQQPDDWMDRYTHALPLESSIDSRSSAEECGP
jgi:hypothetical protein